MLWSVVYFSTSLVLDKVFGIVFCIVICILGGCNLGLSSQEQEVCRNVAVLCAGIAGSLFEVDVAQSDGCAPAAVSFVAVCWDSSSPELHNSWDIVFIWGDPKVLGSSGCSYYKVLLFFGRFLCVAITLVSWESWVWDVCSLSPLRSSNLFVLLLIKQLGGISVFLFSFV